MSHWTWIIVGGAFVLAVLLDVAYWLKRRNRRANSRQGLLEGCVGFWPFWEGHCRDVSGNGNHGTLTEMEP